MYKIKLIVSLTVLLLTTLACNYVAPTQAPRITVTPVFTPTSLPLTVIVEPTSSRQQTEVPITEATIPRVTIEEALTAMTAAAAVIVDVRSTQSYAVSHIKNAVSIPLSEIETNPTGLNLDKDEWIITYCT